MNDKPMTAEQRVRAIFNYPEGALEHCNGAVYAETLASLMDEQAKAEVEVAEKRIAELARERNEVYSERNRLVAALSKIFPSSIENHDPLDLDWDREWLTIIAVNLPTGQATWHVHDDDRAMFEHLKPAPGYAWDGHTTETKYARLAELEVERKGSTSACSATCRSKRLM